MLESLLSYLKQPSTYQGLATIAASLGFVTFPELFPLIVTGLGIFVGGVQVIKNDDPERQLLKKKQLIAKAEQMGLTLKEK